MPRLFDEPDPRPRPRPGDHSQDSPRRRPGSPGQAEPIPVAALVGQIKQTLNTHLPGKLRVVGEVSNLSDRNHWYFSLKDGQAAVRCVMFASAARQVRFPVRDGLAVVATGAGGRVPGSGPNAVLCGSPGAGGPGRA